MLINNKRADLFLHFIVLDSGLTRVTLVLRQVLISFSLCV